MNGPGVRVYRYALAPIVLDDSQHPIILITLPRAIELHELDRHFDRMIELAPRGPFITVTDIRAADVLKFTASHRQRTADNYKRLKHMRRLMIGEAWVLESPVMRGVLTALTWLVTPRWPVEHFGDLESALKWAEGLIKERRRAEREPTAVHARPTSTARTGSG